MLQHGNVYFAFGTLLSKKISHLSLSKCRRQLQLEVSSSCNSLRRTISASAFRDCGNQVYTLIKREGRMFLLRFCLADNAWLLKGCGCLRVYFTWTPNSTRFFPPRKRSVNKGKSKATSLLLSLSSRPQCIPESKRRLQCNKS